MTLIMFRYRFGNTVRNGKISILLSEPKQADINRFSCGKLCAKSDEHFTAERLPKKPVEDRAENHVTEHFDFPECL